MVLCLLAVSCIFGGGAQTRTVFVDYTSDEFPSAFLTYFPRHVYVHPGDTVVFKQFWSGEAHSVTMGVLADKLEKVAAPYVKLFDEKAYAAEPQQTPPEVKPIDDQVRYMFTGENDSKVAQNGAQPCYLDKGLPPADPNKPCTKAQQVQPEFTGRQYWYNSGYIHYAGPNGNEFRVKVSKTATPGSYYFFCNNHGPFMRGVVEIKPTGEKIRSQASHDKETAKEINAFEAPLRRAFHDASARQYPIPRDQVEAVRAAGFPTAQQGGSARFLGRFAGLGPEEGTGNPDAGFIVGFVPNRIQVHTGEKVTWIVLGGHTISFNVPQYFPIFTIRSDGAVVRNPKLDPPAGGSPPIPQSAAGNGPPKPLSIDGGTWNGQGFLSSGLIQPDTFASYSVRISKPGTYKFACLVHPLMVGTVVVT